MYLILPNKIVHSIPSILLLISLILNFNFSHFLTITKFLLTICSNLAIFIFVTQLQYFFVIINHSIQIYFLSKNQRNYCYLMLMLTNSHLHSFGLPTRASFPQDFFSYLQAIVSVDLYPYLFKLTGFLILNLYLRKSTVSFKLQVTLLAYLIVNLSKPIYFLDLIDLQWIPIIYQFDFSITLFLYLSKLIPFISLKFSRKSINYYFFHFFHLGNLTFQGFDNLIKYNWKISILTFLILPTSSFSKD